MEHACNLNNLLSWSAGVDTPVMPATATARKVGIAHLQLSGRAIALACVFVVCTSCGRPADDPRTEPPRVSVIRVKPSRGGGQTFTGVVRARIESELAFRVGGKIAERLVDAGQPVRRGQVLMRLDASDLVLLAAAERAAVDAARARSVQARADLARMQGLIRARDVSVQTFDLALAAADTARAQLAAAEAQARVADHSNQYADLTADADGVVQDILAEPGQVVGVGQVVLRLAHSGPREAQINLPETVHPSLGSTATGVMYGQSEAAFPATLRQLSQSADPATRTFDARYVLGGAGERAALGSTISLNLPQSGTPTSVSVPLGAIYDPGAGPGIWSVADNHVRLLPIRLIALRTEDAVVTGIPADTEIVALGADRLRPGQLVRTAPLPGTQTAASQ